MDTYPKKTSENIWYVRIILIVLNYTLNPLMLILKNQGLSINTSTDSLSCIQLKIILYYDGKYLKVIDFLKYLLFEYLCNTLLRLLLSSLMKNWEYILTNNHFKIKVNSVDCLFVFQSFMSSFICCCHWIF